MISRLKMLKKLVEHAQTQKAFSWLSHIDTAHARFEVRGHDRSIPTKDVQHIYSVRAKINEGNGRPISGFEELLKNLEITGAEGIVIHLMEDITDQEYFVFTDPYVNELLGVLGPLRSEMKSYRDCDCSNVLYVLDSSPGQMLAMWKTR